MNYTYSKIFLEAISQYIADISEERYRRQALELTIRGLQLKNRLQGLVEQKNLAFQCDIYDFLNTSINEIVLKIKNEYTDLTAVTKFDVAKELADYLANQDLSRNPFDYDPGFFRNIVAVIFSLVQEHIK